MRQVAGFQVLDLRFGLLASDLLGIVDEQRDDSRIVVVALPEFLREVAIPADLFGQLTQNG